MRPGRVYVPVEAPISIVSTIARQSLGVDYYRVWDSDIDDEEERSWSSTEEGWIVDHLMEWYLRKVGDKPPLHVCCQANHPPSLLGRRR